MTHEAFESNLRSVVRSSMHPYPGNWVAIGRAVVYYAWTAREFSAGIKCQHCSTVELVVNILNAVYKGGPSVIQPICYSANI